MMYALLTNEVHEMWQDAAKGTVRINISFLLRSSLGNQLESFIPISYTSLDRLRSYT